MARASAAKQRRYPSEDIGARPILLSLALSLARASRLLRLTRLGCLSGLRRLRLHAVLEGSARRGADWLRSHPRRQIRLVVRRRGRLSGILGRNVFRGGINRRACEQRQNHNGRCETSSRAMSHKPLPGCRDDVARRRTLWRFFFSPNWKSGPDCIQKP
jgi:hypothetical protein